MSYIVKESESRSQNSIHILYIAKKIELVTWLHGYLVNWFKDENINELILN